MKRFLPILLCGLLLINADLFARGSSSSVSHSSFSSSRSSSSSSSSISKSTTSYSSKPYASSSSGVTQSMQKQSAMGNSAFGSQSQAASSRSSSGGGFSFFPPAPPRLPPPPPPIPRDYITGGIHYHVVFRNNGYGYYDPTGLWIAVAAANVLSAQDAQRYNQYYVNPSSGHVGRNLLATLIALIMLGGLITIIAVLVRGWR